MGCMQLDEGSLSAHFACLVARDAAAAGGGREAQRLNLLAVQKLARWQVAHAWPLDSVAVV